MRRGLMVGLVGLEPTASSSRTTRATNCAIARRNIFTFLGLPTISNGLPSGKIRDRIIAYAHAGIVYP